MVSNRKAIKAQAQWDDQARRWATHTGRGLAVDLYHGRRTATRPYGVGVVLDAGETLWSEVPVRFNRDRPDPPAPGQRVATPAVRPWLVTSGRVVGRLADGNLRGYRWEKMVGLRVDLTAGNETVAIDIDGDGPLVWTGAALAPMAVAAVFRLHGPVALVEHPGLSPLRAGDDWPQAAHPERDDPSPGSPPAGLSRARP